MVVPLQLWVLRERRPIPELEAAPRTLATDTLVRTASYVAATPWVYSSAGLHQPDEPQGAGIGKPQQPELGASGHTPVVEGQHPKEVIQGEEQRSSSHEQEIPACMAGVGAVLH
jgi:hypothetical protein